jgi:hypothetical protein
MRLVKVAVFNWRPVHEGRHRRERRSAAAICTRQRFNKAKSRNQADFQFRHMTPTIFLSADHDRHFREAGMLSNRWV